MSISKASAALVCLAVAAMAGLAEAEPLSLSGGGENSYGYGAQGDRAGPVLDLRSATGAAAAPAPAAEPWQATERVGPPYQAGGRWYVPTAEPGYAETGMGSWYGPGFHGRATASGEVYDQEALTAAHPTLPINSLVQVTNLDNGREIIVRVNDRGPFAHQRLIDVSRVGAEVLGFERAGQARVHVRYLGPAPQRVPAAANAPAAVDAAPGQQNAAAILAGAASGEAGFVVQVGAFSNRENAERVRNEIASAGPVLVDARQNGGGELFRVRVGPWPSRDAAENARQSLALLGYSQSIVAPH